MTRIYTKTGDRGETSLADGSRSIKSSPRVSLYGEIDELNSVVGHALSVMQRSTFQIPQIAQAVGSELINIQSRLFDLGAVLANPSQSEILKALPAADQPFSPVPLELSLDSLDKSLPPLRSFILPGGCEAAAILHVGRCVCRRTERAAVALATIEDVPAGAIIYLNRLSDFLFSAARALNVASGIADVPWVGNDPISSSDSESED